MKDKKTKEKTEEIEKTKGTTDTNAFYLLGGLIGAIVGIKLSFNLFCHLTTYEPDFCQSIVHICTILLIILIIFGAVCGAVAGNIIFFLREIFPKKGKRKKL